MQFRVGSNVPAQRVGARPQKEQERLNAALRAGITTPTETPADVKAAAAATTVDSPTFESFAKALREK